jgi:hypothetical protein
MHHIRDKRNMMMKKRFCVLTNVLALLSVSSVVAMVLSLPAKAADSHDHSMSTAPVTPATLTEWAQGRRYSPA